MTLQSLFGALPLLRMSAGLALVIISTASQANAQKAPSPPTDKPGSEGGAVATPAAGNSGTPTAAECIAAHRESQELRRQLKLVESRSMLGECGNAACPGPVKRDCLRWVDEIAAQLPSVVFRLEGSGDESARNVRIYVDGELRFQVVPNRSVDFNPGSYRFRFEADGKAPVELDAVLGEAEKFKAITVRFDSEPKPGAAPPSPTSLANKSPAPLSPTPTVESRPVPLASYIFAGLGVAATINFAAWGLSSKSLVSELEDKCAPNCEQEYLDRVRLRSTIADISLGVGVASFATATLFYFLRPTVSVPVEMDVGVLPRGGVAAAIRVKAF